MESKEMLDLRYKRLNYYNKLINKTTNSTTATTDNKNYFQIIDNLTLNNKTLIDQQQQQKQKETKLQTYDSKPDSFQFINNFFEGNQKPSKSSADHHSITQSTTQTPLTTTTNKKLEEFKKVVEDSYNLHVVKKNETNKQITTTSEPIKEDLKLRNIFSRQLSTESSLDSNRTGDYEQANSFRSSNNDNNTTLSSYKIPYMSAYNIYTDDLNNTTPISSLSNRRVSVSSTLEAHNIMEKYLNTNSLNNNSRKMSIGSNEDHLVLQKNEEYNSLNKKSIPLSNQVNKLSSSGSSLNASPTSQSSSSSSFNLPKQTVITQPFIHVKPPETPRNQSSTIPSYRKNLLRLSIDTAKSLDLKNDSNQIRQSVKLTDSLDSTQTNTIVKNEKLIDTFFNNKPISSSNKIRISKKNINKKNNVFKLVNEYDDDEDAKAEDYSLNEEKNDTFDIFSSEESLEKTIEENVKNFDLNIDLALLSDHDNEESLIVNNNNNKNTINFNTKLSNLKYDSDEDCSILENDNLTSNLLSSGRQQTLQKKPDNIPNLMLDLIDDDKSTQSVAASLAKSMCKEIDYQKEMEILYTLANKEHSQQDVQLKKTNTSIHLNKVINTTNVLKPQPQVNELAVVNKLKNSNLKPPQSARQQRVINKNDLDLFNRPESAAAAAPTSTNNNSNKISQQSLNYNRNSRLKLSKIDLTNQQNSPRQAIEASKSPVKKSKNFLINSRDASLLNSNKPKKKEFQLKKNLKFLLDNNNQRPSSAMSNLPISNINNNNDDLGEKRSKSSLFFNYSKLVTIESNLKDDSVRSFEIESELKATSNMVFTLGDQEAYRNIFINEKNLNENDSNSIEANWLDLPDEIWLKIIKFLDHKDLADFGSSCKRFRNLYMDRTLWRKITLKYKYEVKDDWLIWIGQRRPNELNIVQCNGNLTLSAIVEMFRSIGHELKSLNLSRCSNVSLSGDNFALQASIRCPNITNLDLSWTLLSNQTLKLITDSFNKIESINLSGCSMIGEDGFNFFIQRHGETLKSLEISGLIHFSASCILNIGVYCRQLEKLNISNCHRMTNESIMEACPQWLKLKFLDLRGIKSIKNNCVSTIVRRCTSMEGLALGECIHLSDASILEIATYKPNIKYLDINGCKKITDNSIRSIANFCVNLEYLNLRATNITDMGLISLANGKCSRTLEEINLSYLPISELILIKILKNALNLKRIQLYGCYNIKKLDEIKKTMASENNKQIHINI